MVVKVFRYLIKKEFLQLRRDRKMLPLVFVAPILQLVLLGYAANLDVRDLPLAVYDLDQSAMSRDLTERFLNTRYFHSVGSVEDPQQGEDLLIRGTAAVVLTIPTGFSANIVSRQPSQIQLLIDGTNSTVGSAIRNYSAGIVQLFQMNTFGDTGKNTEIEIRSRVWYNPEMESKFFMVPGILAILLMLVTTVLASLAIVKEKELGTFEQLSVTPITPSQMIIGKLIPFVIIGIVDVVLVLIVSRFVFAIPFRGSIVLLFFASILFLASTLSLGLLVSMVSQNQQQAMLTAAFFVMIPMFFLSGFAFPIESMPKVIRWSTYLFPLRYYLQIIRGIFLKGVGLSVLWEQFLALAIFGAGILVLASLRFQKRSG